MSEDRAPPKKPPTFLTPLGTITTNHPEEQFKNLVILPGRRYACADSSGFISVVTDLTQTPEKIDSGLRNCAIRLLEESKLIVTGYSREDRYSVDTHAFLLDIDSKDREKKQLDGKRFGNVDFVKFKSGSKEYLAMHGQLATAIEVCDITALDKAPSEHKMPQIMQDYSYKHAWVNNVAVVGDKVVASFDTDGLAIWSTSTKPGELVYERDRRFPEAARPRGPEVNLIVFGSQDYLVLMQSGLSVRKFNAETSQFDLLSQSPLPRNVSRSYCKFFPDTAIFAYIHPDKEKITIKDCRTGDSVTAKLPAEFGYNLQLSEDGRIVYTTDKGTIMVMQGQFILSKEADAVMGMLTEPGRLSRDPANIIVSGYLRSSLLTLPVLKMTDVEAAAAACPKPESKAESATVYPPLFSASAAKDTSANAHHALIEKLRKAENDADRYVIADAFMRANPEHVFTKELTAQMKKTAAVVTARPG